MVKVTIKNPPRIQVKIAGYTGEPTGKIVLKENHKTYNVKAYAEAETDIPDPIAEIDPSSLEPVVFGADSGGLYMSTENEDEKIFYLGRDIIGLYVNDVI